jgi:hypothetical protein
VKKLAVGLVLLLSLLGFGSWRMHQRQALEQRLSRIASALAGRPVKVHCQSNTAAVFDVTPESGSVMFGADGRPVPHTDLKHDICNWLGQLPHGTVAQASFAVAVLTHESEHLAGYQDEAVTQCRALQLMAWTAEQLGATPHQAKVWTAYAVAATPSMPEEYYDPACPAFRAQTTIPSPQ